MSDDQKLDLEGGGDDDAAGKPKKTPATKGPGRPSGEAKARDRATTITGELGEVAEWIKKKDPELAEALSDGAPRMAKVLSARASKHARVAKIVDVVFAADGPLAILRGFGPTMRLLGDRLGARRDPRTQFVDAEGFLVDPDTGLQILDEAGAPIRGDT